ncbi:MAG: ADP-ribosylglycohydrolase family protein, partial [Mycobacteriales bacterium]
MSKLTTAQRDRAAGGLLATAAGDALGAGYEFGPPLAADTPLQMRGGGGFGWAPGEWTDDTSMAIPIARAAAGLDLRADEAQDRIAAAWFGWARRAKDVGSQTRTVLTQAGRAAAADGLDAPLAQHVRAAARAQHEAAGRSGGNGSLMRTAPVALAFLDDAAGLIEAAVSLSALTHVDPEAGEACALWCLAIRHAVLTGDVDVRRGLAALPAARATVWADRLDAAGSATPDAFARNGWVVEALQGAWSAISGTPVPAEDRAAGIFRVQHLRLALEAGVRGGCDTDTVAAIAGGLLGAAYGASAVPATWRRIVHGWPGLRARGLL